MSISVSPSRSVRRGPAYLRFGGVRSALIAAVAIILVWTSTEPALTFASLAVLVGGAKLLWRPGEPPILFAAFFIQWLQASLAVFRASFNDLELASLYREYPSVGEGIVTATWLSLFGLLVLAGGIRLGLRGQGPAAWNDLVAEVRQCSLRKALGAYCVAQFAVLGIEAVTWSFPGLTQALIALSNFRWIFFFALSVIIFVQRRGYWLLAVVCVFEIAHGFLSFFSSYKDVFLVLAIAFLTARPKLNPRTLALTSLIVGAVVVLSAAWTAVKMEYRDYLNAGTGQQIILVGPAEQLTRITDLMLKDGLTHLSYGFDRLMLRVEYTFYFGRVVERVPRIIPHDDGAIWAGALMHVLTPRLLFPDKPSLSGDVLITQRYTGLRLTEQGGFQTEIPMGYMTESYIDFGSLGMFVPIFLLGLLYGAEYRYIITRRRYLIFAFGAAPVVMMTMSTFESSAVKILGANLTTFGVFVIAFALLAPQLYRMLQAPAVKRAPLVESGSNF